MESILIWFSIAVFLATLLGGVVVFKLKHNLHYIFAFSAGSLLAVSFLELLPEAIELGEGVDIHADSILLVSLCAFFIFHLLERFFTTHDTDCCGHHAHVMGPIGAGSLIIHSFFDGVAIGAAFAIDTTVGLIVAVAVLCHDFTDGMNTVVLMLKNKQSKKKAIAFLFGDAIAPVAGILLVSFLSLPTAALAYLLAFFVGEFLYIGATNLLPETKHLDPKKASLTVAAGIMLIIVLSSIAHV